MKYIAISILIFSLVGCFDFEPAKESMISPGDDPLVNRTYQVLLASHGIKYKQNSQGYYVSSLVNRMAMQKLANEAHEQVNARTEIELKNKCVAEEVSNSLAGAIYIIHENKGSSLLETSLSTYEKHQVMIKVVAAERECGVNV